MTFARGINKRVILAGEATWGTQGAGPGTKLRRLQAVINPAKESFANEEILESAQLRDMRHGVFRMVGGISGVLSPGAYAPFWETVVRGSFAALTPISGTGVTAVASPAKFTRASGSWVTDGFRVGDTVRWSGWTTTGAANNATNYIITALTALEMSVSGTVAAKTSGDNVTVTRVGKKVIAPVSDPADTSFSIEHWFGDLGKSELYVGLKTTQVALNIPGSGLVTMSANVLGRELIRGNANVYSSAGAANTEDGFAAATGLLQIGGAQSQVVTGLQLSFGLSTSSTPAVGNQFLPAILQGRLVVSGSFSRYVDGFDIRDLFYDEVPTSLTILLKNSPAANAGFMSFHMPKIKLFSNDKNDSDQAIFEQISFTALENTSSTANGDLTTICIQDSTL